MKKTILILSIITLVFAGCKKFDLIEASKVEIIEENIEKGWDYIKISAEYEYPVELEAVTLYLSEKEDMSGAEAYDCKVEGKKFSVKVEGLKGGVDYYYCYEYDDGYNVIKTENKLLVCKKIFIVNGVLFTMIKVEGGTFQMGATSEQGSGAYGDEKPVHNVTLSDYYIGETEVTQELWEAVMGTNPSNFKGNKKPVERVSWYDCQTFITKLNQLTGKNFRLPTEAEWEYAARGGCKSKGYKYSGSNTIDNVAWYTSNSGSKTHDVKTKQANELGIYDMSGNVYEWCQDWDGSYSSSSQTNPTGPATGSYRVGRGGSWSNYAIYCRVSYRFHNIPVNFNYALGLRLSLSQY